MERSESIDNSCTVCHDTIEIFAIGPCDHPVCYLCSTRMRVLCEQFDCPICRSPMPQVAFMYKKMLFKDIKLRDCIPNRKNKIFYEDEDVEDHYLSLLEYNCRVCHNRKPDKNFAAFQTHMRREHQLFACDLCLNHLKIFPFERKFYNRKNLAIHRRVGDSDDKSYKGHPLCEFCDTRYNDKDELLKHLRKDHYFCHFCDQHGSNAYYDQYPDLRAHFADNHFLCTEGDCANPSTRFTHAFASEIDLKAHRNAEHTKNLSKAQAKEARTLELDFALPPRRQGHSRGGGVTPANYEGTRSSYGGRGRGDRYSSRRRDQEDADLQQALEASKESAAVESRPPVQERVPDPIHDFPSLNGAPVPAHTKPAEAVTNSAEVEEAFPTLSSSRSSKPVPGAPKAYASVMNFQREPKPAAPVKKESKPVSLGSVHSMPKERWSSKAPEKTEEEYPSLGGGSNSGANVRATNWNKKSQSASSSAAAVNGRPTLSFEHSSSNNISSISTKNKSVPPLKPTEDDFPTLGVGGTKRDNNIFGNTFIDWASKKDSKKINSTPKSQKYDDDSFELPESYYKSFNASASAKVESASEGSQKSKTEKSAVKSAPANSLNEFPGLPARESKDTKADTVADKKKKKKNKKSDAKPSANLASKNQDEANASLNDIALMLMGGGKAESVVKTESKKNNTKPSRAESVKKTDWFDNPLAGLENNLPVTKEKNETRNGVATGRRSPKSVPEKPVIENGDNFPSLHTMCTSVQQPRPPPGFTPDPPPPPSASFNAPPGFSTSVKPSAAPIITTTTTTSPAIPPGFASTASYSQPLDFKERNLKLIQEIRDSLESVEDGFSNFRALSGQFRQGVMEASDYYYSCQALMGSEDFSRIFPELLALLPDVGRQQELWEIYLIQSGEKPRAQPDVLRIGETKLDNIAPWQSTQKLMRCATCGQVLLKKDWQHHQLQHASMADFPTLGDNPKTPSNGPAGISAKGSWIKAK